MSTSVPPARNSGLSNAVDIVVSPGSAFARLREVPTWGWAFVIATVLGIAGSLLVAPALLHAMDASMPAIFAASPQIAKLPPDQQQKTIALQMQFVRVLARFAFIGAPFAVLVGGLVQGVIMLIANAAGKGDGTFRKFFALSVTVSVVGVGVNSIVLALIVLVHGAGSYDSTTALQSSVPSLAMLVPGVHGALAGFLGVMNVFALWSMVLLALGMVRVARIRPAAAWTAAVLMLIFTATFAAFGAARNG